VKSHRLKGLRAGLSSKVDANVHFLLKNQLFRPWPEKCLFSLLHSWFLKLKGAFAPFVQDAVTLVKALPAASFCRGPALPGLKDGGFELEFNSVKDYGTRSQHETE
jgi:hypothetical protein